MFVRRTRRPVASPCVPMACGHWVGVGSDGCVRCFREFLSRWPPGSPSPPYARTCIHATGDNGRHSPGRTSRLRKTGRSTHRVSQRYPKHLPTNHPRTCCRRKRNTFDHLTAPCRSRRLTKYRIPTDLPNKIRPSCR